MTAAKMTEADVQFGLNQSIADVIQSASQIRNDIEAKALDDLMNGNPVNIP